MQSRSFHWETHDVLTQFVAAFDDIVIGRFNKNRQEEDRIAVRYVKSPKQRVIYDIINSAKNITLPACSLTVNRVSRDVERVFNKESGFYYNKQQNDHTPHPSTTFFRSPVPVDIYVTVSMIAKYQMDMDQILSNFIPFCNPYVVLSWKVPEDFGLQKDQEIRSTVIWSGEVDYEYPDDIKAEEKFQLIANTNFVIKSWLFKEEDNPEGNIYEIKTNFYNERLITNYEDLSGRDYELQTPKYAGDPALITMKESFVVSGAPLITNWFYQGNEVRVGENYTINQSQTASVILYGDQYEFTDYVMLSSNDSTLLSPLTVVKNFPKQKPLSGFLIEDFERLNNNIITFNMPALSSTGSKVDFVAFNVAGYSTTFHATSSHIILG